MHQIFHSITETIVEAAIGKHAADQAEMYT